MKITEKTTIGELIPEGYELKKNITIDQNISPVCNEYCIAFICKKKEVKDFNWYRNEYMKMKDFFVQPAIIKQRMIETDFDKVPFEMKIGLLKFICDDNELESYQFMHVLIDIDGKNEMILSNSFILMTKICPPEFLNSIFK